MEYDPNINSYIAGNETQLYIEKFIFNQFQEHDKLINNLTGSSSNVSKSNYVPYVDTNLLSNILFTYIFDKLHTLSLYISKLLVSVNQKFDKMNITKR